MRMVWGELGAGWGRGDGRCGVKREELLGS